MSHKTGKLKKCLECGNTFYVAGWRLKINKGKFCSRTCQDKRYNLPFIERVCVECNKTFTFKPVFTHGYKCWKRKDPRHCSNKCFKKERVEISCLLCGKKRKVPPSVIEIGSGLYCSRKCLSLSNWANPEYRKKLIIKHREITMRGEKSPFWKGGLTSKNLLIRGSSEYRQWRKSVFKRDDWTCQWCGERGGNLNADHIKPFCLFPDLRFNIDNGRTLCKPCHLKTDTWGNKALTYNKHE